MTFLFEGLKYLLKSTYNHRTRQEQAEENRKTVDMVSGK